MAEVGVLHRQADHPASLVSAQDPAYRCGRGRSSDPQLLERSRHGATTITGKTLAPWRPEESSIPEATQNALITLEWVGRHENLVISGPSGMGKSHFTEGLAAAAIESDMRVAWFTLETPTQTVNRAKADGSVARAVARICSVDLVVVDDIGMLPGGQEAAAADSRRCLTFLAMHRLGASRPGIGCQPTGTAGSGDRPQTGRTRTGPADLAAVKERTAHGLGVLGLRFSNDRGCPAERLQTLRTVLGDAFEGIEIDSSPGNPHAIPTSALTMNVHRVDIGCVVGVDSS